MEVVKLVLFFETTSLGKLMLQFSLVLTDGLLMATSKDLLVFWDQWDTFTKAQDSSSYSSTEDY